MTDRHATGERAGGAAEDETRRLLAAVQEWARRTLPAPPAGHSGPECQWCPLCQLASVLRGEHPELLDRVAEAGTAVADAVRALAESAARASAPARPAGRPRPRPGPRVQRIDLSDPSDPADPATEPEEKS